MTTLVVDASVAVKWALRERADEYGRAAAEAIFRRFGAGTLALLQPPHWIAEVAAVIARVAPGTALQDVADLLALKIPVASYDEVYLVATSLAAETGAHVFDTLYHAVALDTDDAMLVTADEDYFRRTRRRGRIVLLSLLDLDTV